VCRVFVITMTAGDGAEAAAPGGPDRCRSPAGSSHGILGRRA
jgi:hypothetical protein